MSDDIIAACIRGERKAQNALYSQYANAMYNVALRIVNDVDEAQDVLQMSFVDAFKHLHQYNNTATMGSWLKRIVINRAISQLRKKKLMTESWDNQTHEFPDDTAPIEESILSIEKIKSAMNEMPEGYRVVLNLYLIEGYDHGEIADILQISTSTSKTQYHRAKHKLRALLNKYQKSYG